MESITFWKTDDQKNLKNISKKITNRAQNTSKTPFSASKTLYPALKQLKNAIFGLKNTPKRTWEPYWCPANEPGRDRSTARASAGPALARRRGDCRMYLLYIYNIYIWGVNDQNSAKMKQK
jgi:hypothetical protein